MMQAISVGSNRGVVSPYRKTTVAAAPMTDRVSLSGAAPVEAVAPTRNWRKIALACAGVGLAGLSVAGAVACAAPAVAQVVGTMGTHGGQQTTEQKTYVVNFSNDSVMQSVTTQVEETRVDRNATAEERKLSGGSLQHVTEKSTRVLYEQVNMRNGKVLQSVPETRRLSIGGREISEDGTGQAFKAPDFKVSYPGMPYTMNGHNVNDSDVDGPAMVFRNNNVEQRVYADGSESFKHMATGYLFKISPAGAATFQSNDAQTKAPIQYSETNDGHTLTFNVSGSKISVNPFLTRAEVLPSQQ